MASPDSPEQPKLTLKRQLFVDAYLGDAKGNATDAARRAGYKHPHPEGSRLLRNATILARVREHVSRVATADQVLGKLAEIALAPSFEFIEVIARNKEGKPIKVRMDLGDQVKALELLGKYHQLFIDRQVVDVNMRDHRVGVPQSTLETLFRAADHTDRADA